MSAFVPFLAIASSSDMIRGCRDAKADALRPEIIDRSRSVSACHITTSSSCSRRSPNHPRLGTYRVGILSSQIHTLQSTHLQGHLRCTSTHSMWPCAVKSPCTKNAHACLCQDRTAYLHQTSTSTMSCKPSKKSCLQQILSIKVHCDSRAS